MAEEIEESEFYREDFSTESEWEVFVAQLGEICQKWELSEKTWGEQFTKDEMFSCQWDIKQEKIVLEKQTVTVKYYAAKLADSNKNTSAAEAKSEEPMHSDLMSTLNSFSPKPLGSATTTLHPIARSYGLRRFVVMLPSDMRKHYLTNPDEFKFFASAANVVAMEICSAVPIFVQIYDVNWNYYIGVGLAKTMRTNFNIIAIHQTPETCRYLTGLLTMFKEKVRATYIRPATVSVQNTYELDTIKIRMPFYQPFKDSLYYDDCDVIEDVKVQPISVTKFITLPHGFIPESNTKMFAVYTWPEIAENIALDSALTSVFVPSKAARGSIHYVAYAPSYLTACLDTYCSIVRGCTESLESLVGRNFSGTASAADVANPLDQLTKTSIVPRRQPRHQRATEQIPQQLKKIAGPMKENELHQMMCFLFPDLKPEEAIFPYETPKRNKKEFDPLRIKSALPDSLVCRLSCLLATVTSHCGYKNGLAQLWATFTRELRYSWDNCIPVAGVAAGFPDTRTCLLHQKLQMLNVCIERCAIRQFGSKSGEMPLSTSLEREFVESDVQDDNDDDEEDEDEFFDADGEGASSEAESRSSIRSTKSRSATGLNQAEGRLKRLGKLKLWDNEDEWLYVPITQEPVPKTEDQLQDDAEVMLKLGPGSGLTTQMMCSSLLSDMEAFKAANPKAKMEDFIRWYSPKDWEETTSEDGRVTGSLSPRMQSPDNTWQLVWKQAHPIPVSSQKRLFDDTNEALKVLHYLETRTIGEIYELTAMPLLHSAVIKLQDILETAHVLDIFKDKIDSLLADLCRLSRDSERVLVESDTETDEDPTYVERLPDVQPWITQLQLIEQQFYQYKCFEHSCGYPHCIKLDEVKKQFKEILANNGSYAIVNKNVATSNDDQTSAVLSSRLNFKNEMRDQLLSKEYVIRLDGETTHHTKGQTVGPQFLRALITGEQLRLCGAFTENTTFLT